MERDRPGTDRSTSPPDRRTTWPEPPARPAAPRTTRFAPDNRPHAGDPAPETDEISGTRADYAPTGADPKPTTGGTIKRTLKEFSEDNLTDWAAALTYYGVLALFPALVALLSIIGLLVDPQDAHRRAHLGRPGQRVATRSPR